MKDAQTILKKYETGVTNGAPSWLAGVNAVKQAPGIAAAAQADVWFAKIQQAHQDGRYASRSAAVTLQQWQAACKDKGQGAYSNSAKLAAKRWGDYWQQAAPSIQGIQDAVRAMPKTTAAEADARMLEAVKRMRELKGKFKARK